MRRKLLFVLSVPWLCAACAPEMIPQDGSVLGVLFGGAPGGDVAPAAGGNSSGNSGGASGGGGSAGGGGGGGSSVPPATPAATPASGDSVLFTGNIAGASNYRLFELTAGGAAERFTLESGHIGYTRSLFTVVLFDADMNLLHRTPSFPFETFEHVLRRESGRLFVGVKPTYDDSGGDFFVRVRRQGSASIPSPAKQVVYLDFDGARNIGVHTRSGLSFDGFDAAVLGSIYRGYTDEVRRSIVQTVRDDYRDYNVTIVASFESGPPSGDYSTVYFGDYSQGLLGLADNVDLYNAQAVQNAIVFTESFEPFSVMQLTPEEMGVMVGNVASHELGHLLGLYHTRNPSDVMDTTGTAWDLAGEQRFDRAELDATVFPVGMENSPMLLGDTVGRRSPEAVQSLRSPQTDDERFVRRVLRDIVEADLADYGCGLCGNPAE